jgi:hypothetical protein
VEEKRLKTTEQEKANRLLFAERLLARGVPASKVILDLMDKYGLNKGQAARYVKKVHALWAATAGKTTTQMRMEGRARLLHRIEQAERAQAWSAVMAGEVALAKIDGINAAAEVNINSTSPEVNAAFTAKAEALVTDLVAVIGEFITDEEQHVAVLRRLRELLKTHLGGPTDASQQVVGTVIAGEIGLEEDFDPEEDEEEGGGDQSDGPTGQ